MTTGGFSGTVTNTSLHDVIQLVCIGRNTCRIVVRSREKQGVIHVKEGEIIHAYNGEKEGEEAFYKILSWELGVFQCDTEATESETIQDSWDFLLMESMRRLDSEESV